MDAPDDPHAIDHQQLNDPRRLDALRRSGLLDDGDEAAFDRAVRLASRMLGTRVSLLSLVDEDRQVFKAQTGMCEPWASAGGTPLSHSFCQHVVTGQAPLVIADARSHPLTQDNAAIEDLGVVSYLGVPVRAPDGEVLGAFCVIGDEPREWTADELAVLSDLGEAIVAQIGLRAALAESDGLRREAESALVERSVLVEEMAHRTRNLFAIVPALVTLSAETASSPKALAATVRERLAALAKSHELTLDPVSPSRGLPLGDLAHNVMKPYGASAIGIDGPALHVTSRTGNALGLILHELATNAAKYGALSASAGTVAISWKDSGENLRLDWVERGGPACREPEVTGFGTRLIETLAGRGGSTVLRDWPPEGLTVRLTFPESQWRPVA